MLDRILRDKPGTTLHEVQLAPKPADGLESPAGYDENVFRRVCPASLIGMVCFLGESCDKMRVCEVSNLATLCRDADYLYLLGRDPDL